jgi:hypothetical protein
VIALVTVFFKVEGIMLIQNHIHDLLVCLV